MSWSTSLLRMKPPCVVKPLHLCSPKAPRSRKRRRDSCFHNLNGYRWRYSCHLLHSAQAYTHRPAAQLIVKVLRIGQCHETVQYQVHVFVAHQDGLALPIFAEGIARPVDEFFCAVEFFMVDREARVMDNLAHDLILILVGVESEA